MSDTQYHKARLEENFQALLKSPKDDGQTQRACMYIIMSCCNTLRLDLRDYLREKFLADVGTHSPLPAYSAKDRSPADNRSFKCRDCGMTFLTKQARAGHMAHCKKGAATEGGTHD